MRISRQDCMEIIRLPVLSDNYVFILYSPNSRRAVVIDPAVPKPVLAWLEEHDALLEAIWNTHHHSDHVGANRTLLEHYPGIDVVAGQYDFEHRRIPGQTRVVAEGDRLEFAGRHVTVFDCPGHTLGHIAYFIAESENDSTPHLFCGDTLFSGGCGRLFEGSPQQMVTSIDKFRQLPRNTQIWCAHEYTLNNLKFAMSIDEENEALKSRINEVKQKRQMAQATIPTTLNIELSTNPFLRWDQDAFHPRFGNSPAEVFGMLRKMKDRY